MTFREAVEKAISRWNGIYFHWNKSQQSTNAVMALQGIIEMSTYDDDLYKATMWLTGQSDVQYNYKGLKLAQLKKDSSLAKFLDEELGNAKSRPNLRPQISSSTRNETEEKKKEKKKEKKVVKSSNESTLNYLSSIKKHEKDWENIEITDIPTETPGVYEYTEKDKQTTNIKGSAAMKLFTKGVKYIEIVDRPEYWVELGRLVSIHKFGRCYSCAALVVYTLVMDTAFDEVVIAVYGNSDYDHQFVRVGTLTEVQDGKGYAIDIWQSNLDKQTPAVLPLSECRYAKGNVKPACVLYPKDRAALRSFFS